MNLSSRLKEFDTKTCKKLLCSLQMSKLLLKFFIAFYELNKSVDTRLDNTEDMDEDREEDQHRSSSRDKLLSRSIVEKAAQQTELVPDQNLFAVMLVKKSQYTREFLMPKSRH